MIFPLERINREGQNGKNHAKLHLLSKSFVMTIQEAQQQVDHWIQTIGKRYFGELTNMAILTEEVGELSRHMSRVYGEQSYRPGTEPANMTGNESPMADEMADVLWVLICLANQTGVDLTAAFQRNLDKKTGRDADRHQNNPKLQ